MPQRLNPLTKKARAQLSRRVQGATVFSFLLISVTYTIGWTTISSELSYFSHLFGPEILLQLHLAYFLPSIPALLLQSYLDEYLDKKFGAGNAASVRFAVGFAGVLGVSVLFPFITERVLPILSAVVVLGIASGILFGSSYQLVSRFPEQNTVALTLGYVASGPLVLLFNAVFGISAHPTFFQRLLLFASVSAVTVCGLFASLFVFYNHWELLQGPESSDESEADLEAAPLLSPSESLTTSYADVKLGQVRVARTDSVLKRAKGGFDGLRSASQTTLTPAAVDHNGNLPDSTSKEGHSDKRDTPNPTGLRLLYAIFPAAVSLAISISTSILVFPFFTYVASSSPNPDVLPQRLFAARVMSDIGGRILPRKALLKSPTWLLRISELKLALTPLFFLYIDGFFGFYSDTLAIVYVAVLWWLSGYINTCAYVIAPRLVPRAVGSKAGAMMALVFQMSTLAALLVAQLLLALRYSTPPDELDLTQTSSFS